ncbi:peptide chain release factor [Flammeovirga yaeyamensis]|nr:peptide chain release factor [Flammeovirga yaeyamensis]NMF34457.1 peptide chain release factor H [Flammeovirga yaeyamensis]
MKNSNSELYIQITSGRGPAECCWVVAKLLKEVLDDLKSKNIEHQVLSRMDGPLHHTLSSVIIKAKGKYLENQLKEWRGTIQWIGKSPYRKFHKRKNWFVAIDFFAEREVEKLNAKDLQFQTFRGSGPGGQHRNKVETAVRVIHVPSGISVEVSDGKSQHQNKQKALEKMKEKFEILRLENTKEKLEQQWMNHLALERGNAVKVYKGPHFKQ